MIEFDILVFIEGFAAGMVFGFIMISIIVASSNKRDDNS